MKVKLQADEELDAVAQQILDNIEKSVTLRDAVVSTLSLTDRELDLLDYLLGDIRLEERSFLRAHESLLAPREDLRGMWSTLQALRGKARVAWHRVAQRQAGES